jgi:hypothetical protein
MTLYGGHGGCILCCDEDHRIEGRSDMQNGIAKVSTMKHMVDGSHLVDGELW